MLSKDAWRNGAPMSAEQRWDPAFLTRSPAFEPLRTAAACLALDAWPANSALNECARQALSKACNASGVPITFIGDDLDDGLGYEQRIHTRGEVLRRSRDWHDLLNALVWMTFPRAKAALNARHVAEMALETPGRRGRARDALTLFDEGGVIVCASQPDLLQQVRDFHWKDLFWRRRGDFQSRAAVYVFGHAMYQKLLDPFLGVSALALLYAVDDDFWDLPCVQQVCHVDVLAAATLSDPRIVTTPRDLAPFPILGVPGWFAHNENEGFYDNQQYFRPGRGRSSAPSTGS